MRFVHKSGCRDSPRVRLFAPRLIAVSRPRCDAAAVIGRRAAVRRHDSRTTTGRHPDRGGGENRDCHSTDAYAIVSPSGRPAEK